MNKGLTWSKNLGWSGDKSTRDGRYTTIISKRVYFYRQEKKCGKCISRPSDGLANLTLKITITFIFPDKPANLYSLELLEL